MMAENFGVRRVKYTDDQGNPDYADIDFSILKSMNFELNVDIGDSAYWSEITQVNTLDNLFNKGILTDAVTYLENIPDKYVKGKQKVIDSVKRSQEAQQMAAQQQQQFEQQKTAADQAAKILKGI